MCDTENSRLCVFSPEGHFLTKIASKGAEPEQLNNPMSVTLTRDDDEDIVVTDSVNAAVKVFNQKGELVSVFCQNRTFDFPYGVASMSDHHLVVTDVCQHAVYVLYPSGCVKHKWGKYGDGDLEFDHPYHVTVNADDNIVVCDAGNTAIKLFTQTGVPLQKFTMQDFRLHDEHFIIMQGITVDPDGNLLIIGNSTVYICARNGRLWEVLLPSDGLISPKCLAYSHAGHLVITESGLDHRHEISIYEYDLNDFKMLQRMPLAALMGSATGGVVNRKRKLPKSMDASIESAGIASDMERSMEMESSRELDSMFHTDKTRHS